MTSGPQPSPPGDQNPTSLHVRQARQGNSESLEWLIRKFSPLLLASARYRLGKTLGELHDPEDIVNDVWLVAIPRLPELPARDDRYTPVLMKFLSTTLLYRVNNLIQKHIQGKPKKQGLERRSGSPDSSAEVDLEAETLGVVTRLSRQEVRDAVTLALEHLPERDRQIIILRGIEQQPYKEIATLLGETDPKALAVRYQRALAKLRKELPGSVYEEFEDQ